MKAQALKQALEVFSSGILSKPNHIMTLSFAACLLQMIVYSYNGLICGLDAWTQRLGEIFSDQQPALRPNVAADTSIGCTPKNGFPYNGTSPGPYVNRTLEVPTNTYLGWFRCVGGGPPCLDALLPLHLVLSRNVAM